MWRKNRSPIVFLTILCLGISVNAKVHFTKREYRVGSATDNKSFILDSDSIANSSIAYLYCDDVDKNFVPQKCSVIVDTVKFDEQSRFICPFKHEGNHEHYFRSEFQVIPVNKDRALISYISSFKSMRDVDYEFVSIYMPNCTIAKSKIAHVDISIDRGGNRETYAKEFVLANNGNGTFTILYSDEKKCGFNYCRAQLDVEGHIVSEPTSWFKVHKYFYTPDKLVAIKTNSSSIEYAVVYLGYGKDYSELVEFAKVNAEGVKLETIESPVSEFYGGYSITNGLISVCFRTWRVGVDCSQYDLDGNVIFNGHNISLVHTPVLAQPYSLPNGGLLVFTIGCPNPRESYEDDRVCPDFKSQRYHVTKLNVRGEFAGSLEINGFQCNTYTEITIKPHFYENEAGEYCVSLICARKDLTKEFDYTVNCFSDGDFEM